RHTSFSRDWSSDVCSSDLFFLTACASMVRPGGMTFVATINRTMKAAALAIFAAENVLRWLPRGTHQYEKLVRPEEIEKPLTASRSEERRVGEAWKAATAAK